MDYPAFAIENARREFPAPKTVLTCADCGKVLSENESHSCKQQRAANRAAQKRQQKSR